MNEKPVPKCWECEVYRYHSTPFFYRGYIKHMSCNKCSKIIAIVNAQAAASSSKSLNCLPYDKSKISISQGDTQSASLL